MNNRKIHLIVAAIACVIACVGDFLVLFVFGNQYPGYSQLFSTMSSLGASVSPVSDIVSLWWVTLGVLFIVFATGFRKAFHPVTKYVNVAFWLIILYGLGEGLGSGLFKADHIGDSLTTSAIIHDILGGIGVTAILILPLVMQRIIYGFSYTWFKRLSRFVLITGIFLLLLFTFRFTNQENSFLDKYKGLWQRLFVLDYYLYLLVIAFIMIKKQDRPKDFLTQKQDLK